MEPLGDIDRAFAEEISALEGFFDRRADAHSHFGLGRQDPDVRRILEAIAFFSARTRLLALENLRASVERLARGQLDALLAPLPAAGLLEADVAGLAAPKWIPRGTEVRVVAPDGAVGLFSTTRPLALLPLRIGRVEARLEPAGHRLVIPLEASIGLRGALPELPLFVDHRGSYRDSLRLLGALERHTRRVSVAFDADDPERAAPAACSFGAAGAAAGGRDDDGVPPLRRIRSFFHFPAQDLYLRVALPSSGKHWTRAFVYIDLDEEAPAELLRVHRGVLRPFVVPIANERQGEAETLVCDGTKDAYPLVDARPPIDNAGLSIRSVLGSIVGVYQITARGREPIPPAVVSDTSPVWDLVRAGGGHELALRWPSAFDAPCKVAVEARWYQPGFDPHAVGRLEAAFQARHVEGVRLAIRGDIQLHRTSPIQDDGPALLQVLSLRTKTELTRDELVTLLRWLGADRRSHYRRLPELVKGLRVTESPERGAHGTARYAYQLVWKEEDRDFPVLVEEGLVRSFEDRVAALLDAWIADDVELVRFGAEAPAARRPALRALAGGAGP